MSTSSLRRLLDSFDRHMVLADNAEIKMEIYPKNYDEKQLREKLRILKSFGFTDLAYFLYSDFAKDRCDQLPVFGDPHYEALVNQHYTVTVSSDDRKLFEKFEADMDGKFMWRLEHRTSVGEHW